MMVHERDQRILRIQDMLRRLMRHNADTNIANALEKMHAAEVASIFLHLESDERQHAFRVIADTDRRAEILSECDVHVIRDLLEPMLNEKIAELVNESDSDDAKYLLSVFPEERSAEILQLMSFQEPESVEDLMSYPPESAGAIMTDSYVAFHEDVTAEEAIAQVRKASEVENVFYVYVIDDKAVLRGVASLRQLLLSDPQKTLSEVMSRSVWSVNLHADQELVARQVSRYNILAIPVVDDDGVLAGIVTVDDVLDVLREEATEDILKMAGTHHQEEITSLSAGRLAWVRFPWLFISWVGGIVAAELIHVYSNDLSKVVALAAFMPVIIGMAGNVGTQSATIMVRGLATGRVDPKYWFRVVSKEVIVGIILGVCYGVLLGLLAVFQFASVAYLGLVVGLAICLAMAGSAVVASVMPLLLHRFHFDPAVSTGPFVTTAVDVLGILIYFNIARIFLI